jgi:hypothetical protein
MKLRSTLFALAAVVLLQAACLAQNTPTEDPALTAVRDYVKSVNDFAEKQGGPHLIVADVSEYNEDSKPVWKKYSSEEQLENAREGEESYTIAYIWFQENVPVAVNFTYSSPSGDWALYVEYVFRADGSVAGIRRELRTFQGNIAVTNISFLDEKGKLLKETTEFADLETQKPVPPTKNYADIDVEIYKNLKDLPFAAELAVSGKQ